jgi:hypothetical protein
MTLKRRIKRLSKTEALRVTGRKYLICGECNNEEVEVAADIGRITCAYCVQRMIAPPPNIQKKPEGEKFPRGWHFKTRYVHTDGRVFCKGVETGETDTPTKTAVKKKATKKVTKKKNIKKKDK